MPTAKVQPKAKPKKKLSVLDRIGPISFEGIGLKFSIYGKTGTGKTTFCGTFPKPMLYIVCSGCDSSGELLSLNDEKDKEGIETVTLETSDELNELIQHQKDTNLFKTVVLDHSKGLQDLQLQEELKLEKPKVQGNWDKSMNKTYQVVALSMKESIRDLYELTAGGCNVVIVSQEKEFDVEEEHQALFPHIGADLGKSTKGYLDYISDYTLRTFTRKKTETKVVTIDGEKIEETIELNEQEYALQTGIDGIHTIDTRTPKSRSFPFAISDPTFDKLNAYIENKPKSK